MVTSIEIFGIAIGLGGFILAIILTYHKERLKNFWLRIRKPFSKVCLTTHSYYSTHFVVENIKKSDNIIRILCVRNLRVNEADIIEEMKKFILRKDGYIEILSISPDVPDFVISEIMVTLPKSTTSVSQFRKDIESSYYHIFNLYEQLGEKRSHFSYYEYSALPLIHMCQFDDCIHLGLQLYHKEDVAGSLLDYCIEINSGSILGKKILEQWDYLKDKKSTNIFKSKKYQEWKGEGKGVI